jgi:membrane protein DedA with SNARE-associated domain
MIVNLINFLIQIIITTINRVGYVGIFLLMSAESCGIPMPSEVIMPFSGFLVSSGKFMFWQVVIAGTLGNLFGSLLGYFIGLKGGRVIIEKYGKYILISRHDLNMADKWFAGHGELTVLIGRLLPVVRTYISFPAGIAKMNLKKFIVYTSLGAFPWAILFAWLGVKMGNHWNLIQKTLHDFDLVIAALILVFIMLYILRHLKLSKQK